ncbi:triose-phosphate isomerase [Pseudohoeflea coraliihabitans]|uniref:Triosephosphate isomerase n=1 Tax=Pseudohoeflea coraliihabitans TaxID=2860393 RepID=A0ABS6WR87_9HYPH|nr:triose-phosphate isomerase [Pseudohoeflea sp. DP4N28-3]MBW3098479.1 triose-phosphate isomerase [Pseudohoeflea sp. DP4N28-3]
MTPNIRPLVAGNWKMNGLRDSLAEIKAICEGVEEPHFERIDTLICPPATLVYVATALAENCALHIGGQDCHSQESGAFTGDVSAAMLADCLASYCIVGHSERRTLHGEDDLTVRAKAEAAIAAGLTAIICIGETEDERRAGKTLDVLRSQLSGSVPETATAANTVIAYEPVWAIGTGLTPTTEDIAAAHAFMRQALTMRLADEAQAMRLLYGGSVKPGNAGELMAIENVDGALVGGASLKAEDFLAICEAYRALLG